MSAPVMDLAQLPPEIRALVRAVGHVRHELPSTVQWDQVDAACLALFDGVDAVDHPVVRPVEGFAMLACRCGRAIGVGTMYRPEKIAPVGRHRSGVPVDPIVCERCAVRTR